MPTHGPWLTPASVSTTTSPTPASVLTRIQSGPDGLPPETFASVCEKTTGSGVSGDPATSITIALGGSSIREINVAQEFLQMDWGAVSGGMTLFYLGPVPPGASVEYEQPDGSASDLPNNDDPATLVTATVSFGLTANRSTGTPATHLTVMTPEIRYGTSLVATLPGATLAGLTLLGSATAAAALDTAVTISGALTTAAIQPPDGVSHFRHWWNLVLHHHEAITHAAPTTGTAGGADESWGSTISSPSSITITMTYQPPRYRFVYAVLPRLRQFPRDDFLGGAPRQGHGSTSVQASTRQGWRGTYR